MRTYTTKEVAESLRVSPDKVLAWIRSGELEAVDVSTRGSRKKRFRVTHDAFQQFLRSRTTRPAPRPERRARRRQDEERIPEYV